MKPQNASTDGNSRPEKFVAGGGWKSNSSGPRIKVKAVFFSVGAVASVYAGFESREKYGAIALVPGGVLFVAAVFLFFFERYSDLAGPQDGRHDHRNLY